MKRSALRFLQRFWPCAAGAVIANSIALSWMGEPSRVSAWIGMLPLISGVITLLGVAAGGGPLVADQIKAKAGVLGASE
ncbi:MAG: hypothetical protein A2001_01390 [Treponema sp. GWC1_61_84]|nr:MAG: hypothetical protein A2001_01390 [Treponema sp. GWC1_61_84]